MPVSASPRRLILSWAEGPVEGRRVMMQPAAGALPAAAAIDKAPCADAPLPARRELLYIPGPMALLRSVATVGGYTMVSRVLGFVREVLTAAYLGAGPVADAFF